MKNKLRLVLQFASRDFKQKYIGTGLGQLWFFLSPILMISIYTIIFSDIMQLKLSFAQNDFSYSTYLIPGILAWTSFSTIITALSTSFEKKANLIKKINVPMYVFQLSVFLTEFIIFLIAIGLAVIFLIITSEPVSWTFLWMIPVMMLQTIFAFSLGVIFSLFTPFFKDLKVVIPIIIKLWFWMTPIVYMKELIIDRFPVVLTYNPLFHFIDIYHDIFIYSKAPSIDALITITLIAIIPLFIATFLYKRMVSTVKDII
ncbi:MAG: ABC transporter permease [Campylobacterota bacterium]|nr:ABC transporter permease [Campylobacterota bacterium]